MIFWTSKTKMVRYSYSYTGRLIVFLWFIEWRNFQWPWITCNRFQEHVIIRRIIYVITFFMTLLKAKRPSTLTGRNVRLSDLGLLISFLTITETQWDRLFCLVVSFLTSSVLRIHNIVANGGDIYARIIKHVTMSSTISWTRILRLQQFLAHLLPAV